MGAGAAGAAASLPPALPSQLWVSVTCVSEDAAHPFVPGLQAFTSSACCACMPHPAAPVAAWLPPFMVGAGCRAGTPLPRPPTPQPPQPPQPPHPLFSHAMFDLAVPLFEAQHLFGIYRPDAQVLILNQTLNDRWEEVGECTC